MNYPQEEEPNELAMAIEKQRRKWLSRIQQGGGGGGCGCKSSLETPRVVLRDLTDGHNRLLHTLVGK